MVALTNKEVKEFLNSARWIERQIKVDEDYIAQLRQSLEGDVGMDYTRAGTSHASGVPRDFTDTINRIVDYEASLKAYRLEHVEALQRICDVLAQMKDDRLRLLLTLRYRNSFPWNKVAGEMGYTFRQTLRLHRMALLAVKKILTTESDD